MGYSSSGGPKGLGVITDSNTPQSDLTKMIELIARMGNCRVESEGDRDDITGGELYEGLLLFNTTTAQLQVYSGSGWDVIWPPAQASGNVVCPASSGGGSAPLYWSDLIDVTFPAGLFSSPPKVLVQTIGPSGQVMLGGLVEQITTSGCKVRGFRIGSVPSALFSVDWFAVQS